MDETTKALTAKQQQFCRVYIIDLNASAAARRAGYSTHTAEQQGSRLLRNAKVQAEIQQAMEQRSQQANVDAEYVVQRLKLESETAKADSARVQALGLLGRHLGMFRDDKSDESDDHVYVVVRRGERPRDSRPNHVDTDCPLLGDGREENDVRQ